MDGNKLGILVAILFILAGIIIISISYFGELITSLLQELPHAIVI